MLSTDYFGLCWTENNKKASIYAGFIEFIRLWGANDKLSPFPPRQSPHDHLHFPILDPFSILPEEYVGLEALHLSSLDFHQGEAFFRVLNLDNNGPSNPLCSEMEIAPLPFVFESEQGKV